MVARLRAFAHNATCAVIILGAWAFFLIALRHIDYASRSQPQQLSSADTMPHRLAAKAIDKYVKEHSE